jgi:hypothetical protein
MNISLARAVKAIALFFVIEFLLIAFGLLVMGVTADSMSTGNLYPLQVVQDICDSIGTTPVDLSVGIYIIGTFFNLIGMFFSAAKGWI